MAGLVKLTNSGSFKSTMKFFNQGKRLDDRIRNILAKYGPRCVDALKKATPQDSGLTSSSWSYSIENDGLYFYNSNRNNGVPIAIILQYGHATGTGGYVQGRDYINPALRPLFDSIVDEVMKEVQNL